MNMNNKVVRLLLLLNMFLLFLNNPLYAQITFQQLFLGGNTEYGYSIIETTDGGYVIAGITSSYSAGGFDIYLIKIDPTGDTIWTKTFGGANHEIANRIRQTTDGGFIITGYTESYGAGLRDVFLLKTDSAGNFLWTRTYGGINEEVGNDICQTQDSGYIVVGSTSSFGAGGYDMYIIKTDINGDSLWTATAGGVNNDIANSVDETASGLYIITGSTRSFGAGTDDIYLLQMVANGFLIWSKTIGGPDIDYGTSVHQTADGGYIIVGSVTGVGTDRNVSLIKTNYNGDTLWIKTFGGINDDHGSSVIQTSDAGYFISGWTESFGAGNADVYLIKTDSTGNLTFSKTIGAAQTDNALDGIQTSDGGYLSCGYSTSFGPLTIDMYLIKTDSAGESGCNTGPAPTNLYTTAMQVMNPPTLISFPSAMITDPHPVIGSGTFKTPICSSTELNDLSDDDFIHISPNPSSGNFDVSFNKIINDGMIEIINILGESIYQHRLQNTLNLYIRLKNIPGGIYFVKVSDGERNFSKKIVIR